MRGDCRSYLHETPSDDREWFNSQQAACSVCELPQCPTNLGGVTTSAWYQCRMLPFGIPQEPLLAADRWERVEQWGCSLPQESRSWPKVALAAFVEVCLWERSQLRKELAWFCVCFFFFSPSLLWSSWHYVPWNAFAFQYFCIKYF